MNSRISTMMIAAVLLVSSLAFAAVPTSITVQGKLTDAGGAPLSPGGKTFTFRIFDDSTGGTKVWPASAGEVQTITSDAAGLWIGLVGAIAPLTDAVFADNLLWLEIDVDGTTLPRTQFLTNPYAYRVATVDGASGGTITTKVSIGPGHTNTGSNAFVAGSNNTVSSTGAVVSGGSSNDATEVGTVIGGGIGNRASGELATVGGGTHDTAFGDYSTIGGGDRNRANDNYSTIAGGLRNRATGLGGAIGGGSDNFADFLATVGGGANNEAFGSNSVVSGGFNNVAYGSGSAIVGGAHNRAIGEGSFVGGGGTASVGDSNSAAGLCASIPGGRGNRADGNYSFAAGRRAKADHGGTFVWADSTNANFASTDDNQFLIRAEGGVGIGTNDPEGPLHVLETSAGTVTANSNSIIVLERSAGGWISLVSADASQRGILFSEPGSAIAGGILFDESSDNGLSFRTGGNTTRMTLGPTGNLSVTGNITAGGTCCASDVRFKEHIRPIDDPLHAVERLRGVHYEWKREDFPDRNFPEGQQVGLIAQEVREIVPQAVIEQSDGYLAVDYSRLVPLLIEGMKEQQRQIERQNERIANLEKRLEQ